ncbi:MAG: isopentenyl phosphate kinase family protein [Thermoplasmata archaeon]|nr:isopentenyl phosphate kinase family protein [Thermoplasmata archaeon]
MTEPLPVVVKLGGSVLTRKREAARLRPKILTRLAEELAQPGRPPIVVLHGAGSYGHPGAIRWNLARPPADPSDRPHRLRGAAIVGAEVRRLHGEVLRALVDAGLAPFSVPPQAISFNRAGKLARLDTEPFRRALSRGGVPVSFGDVVPDEEWGFSILSADTVAVELVRQLPSRRLVFVSDVEGVLAPAVGSPRRKLIPRLTSAVLASLQASDTVPDVTGGIRGKVESMLVAAEAGADAGLISGLRHGALSRALRGEIVYGSWCEAQVS